MKKFDNYVSHLQVLERAPQEDLQNEFIISGIIDKFTIQFELGWKVLKELLYEEGSPVGKSGSPREVLKTAFCYWDFLDEELWLSMLRDRNDTTHIYDGAAAKVLVQRILNTYLKAFRDLQKGIQQRSIPIEETDA